MLFDVTQCSMETDQRGALFCLAMRAAQVVHTAAEKPLSRHLRRRRWRRGSGHGPCSTTVHHEGGVACLIARSINRRGRSADSSGLFGLAISQRSSSHQRAILTRQSCSRAATARCFRVLTRGVPLPLFHPPADLPHSRGGFSRMVGR
jgi:hypothetical protein